MSKITKSMYPTLEQAHARIDVLNDTIVHYKARETYLVDMISRIGVIVEEIE